MRASLMDGLVELSRLYGADPEMVIAGGGNTSCKLDGVLWVKGSGAALARATPESFVEMDRAALEALLNRDLGTDRMPREAQFKALVLAARAHPEKGQRPSVESVLHHLMPRAFVVHTHSTLVNQFACCREGERLLRERLGDTLLWIGDVDPGHHLARALRDALKQYRRDTGKDCPRAVVMQNHGLVMSGDSPAEVKTDTDWLLGQLRPLADAVAGKPAFGTPGPADPEAERHIGVIAPALRALAGAAGRLKVVRCDEGPAAMELLCGAEGREAAAGGAISPDQIVYCKSFPLWFEPIPGETALQTVERLRSALAGHERAHRFPPQVVLAKGVGLFAIGDDYDTAEAARLVYLDAVKIMAGARRLGGVRYLDPDFRAFIEDWEVESYRKGVAAGAGAAGRAAGRIALVTGAAQGFGLEICREWIAEGGTAVLADRNEEGARREAEGLCASRGAGRALALPVDVTDAASLEAMIRRVVRAYGGFDVLISNAGVVRSGSVLTQSEADFDFVTRVNYKGFFLATQKAAPVLALQHQARPEWLGDIIQINSKSGLVGSNRNGAYAGSKFGGIGLVQSFALELIEQGIKVNAVCPGNFFDGPLWSDPENGLFVQYLRSGKVPGARTVADVRRFYEAKIPMGRGTTTPDVMKAIHYIIEQKYETGQALPVSGGQVMLG